MPTKTPLHNTSARRHCEETSTKYVRYLVRQLRVHPYQVEALMNPQKDQQRKRKHEVHGINRTQAQVHFRIPPIHATAGACNMHARNDRPQGLFRGEGYGPWGHSGWAPGSYPSGGDTHCDSVCQHAACLQAIGRSKGIRDSRWYEKPAWEWCPRVSFNVYLPSKAHSDVSAVMERREHRNKEGT